jgi:hypothetical protein
MGKLPAPVRAALIAAVLGAPPAGAMAAGFASPSAFGELEAGQTVRVSWSSPAAVAFEELELVLSLDGGDTFPVRVTRDLRPDTRSVLLMVPALPSPHARLALRAGDREDPADEEILLVSDDFSICVSRDRPLETTVRARGEWRTRDALAGDEDPVPPEAGTFGADTPALRTAGSPPSACPPRSRHVAEAASRGVPAPLDSVQIRAPGFPVAPLSRAPADVPRRE